MNISDEAVEAAFAAFYAKCDADFDAAHAIVAALSAAAPVLLSHEREEARLAHIDAVVNAQTVDRLETELEQARVEAWERGRVDGYHHRPNPYKETK